MHRLRLLGAVLALAAALTGAGLHSPGAARAALPAPVMGAVGDSYTAGFGAYNGGWDYTDAYWQTLARDMGWQVGNVTATPGGGFQQPGDFGTCAQQLAAHPMPANTAVVIVACGINDANGPSPAGEGPAVARVVGMLHAQAPAARIVVLGVFNPFYDRVPSPTTLPMSRIVRDPHWAGWNSTIIDVFPCQYDLAADGVHPSTSGHAQIGHYLSYMLQHDDVANGGDRPFRRTAAGYWI